MLHVESTSGQATINRLCVQLIDLVGRNVEHRYNKHGGLHVTRCPICVAGRDAENDLVDDLERALEVGDGQAH
jgi:hypothetical protein